jgi:hypothetical protein
VVWSLVKRQSPDFKSLQKLDMMVTHLHVPQDFFGHEYDFVRMREVFIFSFPFFIFDIEKKKQ